MGDLASQGPAESIAIVGMRGRFPGADSVEQLWKRLCDGDECIVTFSEEELREAGVDAETMQLPGFVPRGGVLSDVEMFDAQFFGFSPRDAEVLDPQQRLFMECSAECLEEAGYNPDTYSGLIGVYAGSDQSTYIFQLYANSPQYLSAPMASIGNDKDYLTTLVSYKLNLRGPSIAVQTACSTSLVSVSLACQALLSYQCDMALAGGVCVQVPHKKGYFYEAGGIVSPDGHCRTFDALGQGTVVGSGVGVVLLKRLSEAIAEGDQIHAVIKGTALNNDGALKVGFGAPSVEGQAQVIGMAQAIAGVHPETIEYIEAHGTATLLGDPIEMAALNQVFSASTRKRGYCAIGSLKSNVGHLASAAGVAGLIKAVLALKNEMIPPSLHFTKPNPQISFASSPFFVNTQLREWKSRGGQPRRAGVSSFGVGGTNAHAVLEESPRRERSGPSRPYQLLVLSAKTAAALEAATDNLANHLERNSGQDLADVAYTLQVGRKEYRHRRTLVWPHGKPKETAAAQLRERNPQTVLNAEAETRDRPVVFMFSGQGTQYVNMGLNLYESEHTFREQIDLCSDLLKPNLGLDLRDVLYPSEERTEEMEATLTRTSLAQPALFCLEYALARVWLEWGIVPKAMIGHSIGEYVAACLAGVFTLEEALNLVAYRGYLMDQMPRGSMLAVPLAEKDLAPLLGSDLALAAVNGPSLCVASGPDEQIEILQDQLRGRGIEGRRLHTSHAFHSQMMEPIIEQFVQAVSGVTLKPAQIRYFSNLTGGWSGSEAMDPEYWGRHLRQTVRFGDSLQELAKVPELVYLEVGPGQTLGTLARQYASRGGDHLIAASIRQVHERRHDTDFLLTTAARLWLGGVPIQWSDFQTHEQRHRVPLPTYPFERKRYWVGLPGQTAAAASSRKQDVTSWFYLPTWKPVVTSAPVRNGRGAEVGSRWLVFSSNDSLGNALTVRLEQRGADVVTVLPGESFSKAGSWTYTIRPGERHDYDALISELRTNNRVPTHILHLWSSTPVPAHELEMDSFDDSQNKGFYSLLFMAQSLDAHRITQRIPTGIVTRGVCTVMGDEPLFAPRATVLGVAKSLPQEYSNLRCRVIDLYDETDENADHLIAELVREPFASTVAYRKGRRWTQAYDVQRMSEAPADSLPFRNGGVYLITGGLGKLGLVLAEYLARSFKARVILTGRSSFPDHSEWKGWLSAHDESDPTSRRIRRLLDMEDAGAEVMACTADSANRQQMEQVIERAITRFGGIHGVIHGAGATSADSFGPAKDVDRVLGEKQFSPKVRGLHVLEDVLKEQKLDFCVLLSSISSVLAGLGLLAYASANAYLDVFAAQRNQTGTLPWIGINWDAWLFPEDVALGVALDPNAITPTSGVEAFRRIMARGTRQIVVSTTDLQGRLDKWVNLTALEESAAKKVTEAGHHSRPSLSTEYAAPRTEIEKKIAGVWQDILGISPIGIYDKFFELGGHSLLAVQLIGQLREAFQVELSAQRLFEAPTIAQLSEAIDLELQKVQAEQAQEDEERLAKLLEMVETLTDEEVAEILEKEKGLNGGKAAHA
jgi:acyl transferase domain-containing protein